MIRTGGFGLVDGVGDEGGDDFSDADDDETDEGVKNHILGLFDFTRISGGGRIRDTAVDNKDSGDYAGNANDPLNCAANHGGGIDTFGGSAVGAKVSATKGDTNGIEDNVGKKDNGKTDEGVHEGLFAVGDFARVTTRHGVKVAAVNNETEYEVGGSYGDVGEDVGSNNPNAGFERILIFADIDVAIPGSKAKKVAAICTTATCEYVGIGVGWSGCDRRDNGDCSGNYEAGNEKLF